MKKFGGESKNGVSVFVSERVSGFFSKEITPEILREALLQVDFSEQSSAPVRFTVDLGRIVGRAGVLPVAEINLDTPVLFAVRVGKRHATRVILDVKEPETSLLTLVIAPPKKNHPAGSKLVVAYLGPAAEKEPWDPSIDTDEEYETALQFWLTHVMIYGVCSMSEPFESTWREVLR
jgi:hypothetical protein